MDAVDIKILRTMGLRPYGQSPQNSQAFKPSYIAKQIGVEPKTVKARLKSMQKEGFICFYQIYPNFKHLGINGAGYLFELAEEEQKPEAIKRAAMLDGLLEAHDFLGSKLCIDLSYRSNPDLERKLKLLSEFTGGVRATPFYRRYMPAVERPLSLLDWRILKALRHDALQPLSMVASQLKVSLKTVKRRFDRMAREGSFFIAPALDPGKSKGMMLFELLVYTHRDADNLTIQKILKAAEENYLFHYVPISQTLGNFDMLLFAESTGEIERIRQETRKIAGVSKVDALVLQGWHDFTGWIDAAMQEKIDSLVQNRKF